MNDMNYKKRRTIVSVCLTMILLGIGVFSALQDQNIQPDSAPPASQSPAVKSTNKNDTSAVAALTTLAIKGRAPKTDYAREQFGSGWAAVDACDMRNYILQRDMTEVTFDPKDGCTVQKGVLQDVYTAKTIYFTRGAKSSSVVQIDHVVALSDAWQKGAQNIDVALRAEFANDPLNLLAVDGPANNQKKDSDAASWLPPNKTYRCQYVARQIAVKQKYNLWVTQAEYDSMKKVLQLCPEQMLPKTQ